MHTNKPREKVLIFTAPPPPNVYSFHWISMTEPLPIEAHFLWQHIHLAGTYKRYAPEQMWLIWDVGIRQITNSVYLPWGELCKQRKQGKFDKCVMGREADNVERLPTLTSLLSQALWVRTRGRGKGCDWTALAWDDTMAAHLFLFHSEKVART